MGVAARRLAIMARRTLTFVTGNPNKLEEVSGSGLGKGGAVSSSD